MFCGLLIKGANDMDALQCGYCGTAFSTGDNMVPTGMNCQGCGAPLPSGFMMPPMAPSGPRLGGTQRQTSPGGAAGGILALVSFFVFAIFCLGLFLMISHHRPGAPIFGTSETRTPTGWKFTKPDGSTFEINNPKLSASKAQAMANAFEHQSTSAGNQ